MKRYSLLSAAIAAALACHSSGELKRINLGEIRANPVALRAVDKESEDYLSMVASIKATGVLNPISVRLKKDPESGAPFYEIIDGLHRFMASNDAGQRLDGSPITDIPAQVLAMSDAAVLEAQIIGNVQRVETIPVQYSKQLVRILQANPAMTEAELSLKLGKSPSWVGERLGLLKLTKEAQTLVDSGTICLANAYSLAKLPIEEQNDWLVRAQSVPPAQFVPASAARKKEIDKAKRAGKTPTEEKFVATAHFRRLAEIVEETAKMSVITGIVNRFSGGDPIKAAQLALQWATSMDPDTLQAREAEFNAELLRVKEEKAKRQAERDAKRRQEAIDRAAKVEATGTAAEPAKA